MQPGLGRHTETLPPPQGWQTMAITAGPKLISQLRAFTSRHSSCYITSASPCDIWLVHAFGVLCGENVISLISVTCGGNVISHNSVTSHAVSSLSLPPCAYKNPPPLHLSLLLSFSIHIYIYIISIIRGQHQVSQSPAVNALLVEGRDS